MKTKHEVGQQHKKKVYFYCKKPGHFKRDFTLWLSKKKSKQKDHTANRTTDEAGTSQVRTEHACFEVKENEQKEGWYVDSGATSHMTSDKAFFTYLDYNKSQQVKLADGSFITAEGIGNGKLCCIKEKRYK